MLCTLNLLMYPSCHFPSILHFFIIFFLILFRLGFSSGSASSSNANVSKEGTYESVLVVCVVGGLSYIEVHQVQSVLSEYVFTGSSSPLTATDENDKTDYNNDYGSNNDKNKRSTVDGFTRVILLSTSAMSPEDALNFIS